jgi:thiamine biosynthesis lipoprotein ApbE
MSPAVAPAARPAPTARTTTSDTLGDVRRATWRALGTTVDLVVTDGNLGLARAAVELVLGNVDLAYSRFRPDSELVALNARGGQAIEVSPLLGGAIEASLRAASLTDGLCDPTVGRALRRIGYDDDFAAILSRTDPIILRFEAIPGWRIVRFDPLRRVVLVPPGVELDLGSTGKAYAADLAVASALAAMGHGGALVSLGGDVAVAGMEPAGGWRVLAAEDSGLAPDAPGEVIVLPAGGLATSSTTVRRWQRGGVSFHHIVDPRTGRPAESPWRTVSAIAATCVDANAAATAALIRGESGPEWLAELGLPARFVRVNGAVRRVGGWPQPTA